MGLLAGLGPLERPICRKGMYNIKAMSRACMLSFWSVNFHVQKVKRHDQQAKAPCEMDACRLWVSCISDT